MDSGPGLGKAGANRTQRERHAMKTQLHCPCGEQIKGVDEDDLVEKTQKHLRDEHDGREYTRDEILFMAY